MSNNMCPVGDLLDVEGEGLSELWKGHCMEEGPGLGAGHLCWGERSSCSPLLIWKQGTSAPLSPAWKAWKSYFRAWNCSHLFKNTNNSWGASLLMYYLTGEAFCRGSGRVFVFSFCLARDSCNTCFLPPLCLLTTTLIFQRLIPLSLLIMLHWLW